MSRKIIVAGCQGTVGSELIKSLISKNYNVIGLCRSKSSQDKIQSLYNKDNVLILSGDLTNEVIVKDLMLQANNSFNNTNIYGFINAVGKYSWSTLKDSTLDQYDELFNSNFKSPFLFSRECLNYDVKRMIFISSNAALVNGEYGHSLYGASKAALNKMLQSFQLETKGSVITVCPSIIDTTGNREAMPDADFKKWVQPNELASFLTSLLEDHAEGLHGSTMTYFGKL